jgi:hypothetical protein
LEKICSTKGSLLLWAETCIASSPW